MKTLKYPFLLILFLNATSCEEVLDKQPLDIISDNLVWNDKQLVESYVANLYFETDFMERRAPKTQTGVSFGMIASLGGEARSYGGHHEPYKAATRPITAAGTNLVLDYWRYNNIRDANYALEQLESQSTLDQAFILQRSSEIRYLRAYMYFQMVIRYGGVPLLTKVQGVESGESGTAFVPRNSEQEIYDFIISEMDDLILALPSSYDAVDKGRPTKWAAYAFQSRAALYAASIANYGEVQLGGVLGIPKSAVSTYAQISAIAANAIINNGIHSLYEEIEDKSENFHNVWMDETSANKEVLMVEVFDFGLNRGHPFTPRAMPHDFSGSWGAYYYLYDFVERFEFSDGTPGTSVTREELVRPEGWSMDELMSNRDPRFMASVFYPGTPWKGGNVYLHFGTWRDGQLLNTGADEDGFPYKAQSRNTTKSGFMVRKRTDEDVSPSGGYPGLFNDETDYVVFRLGEIYLNLAEANFYLNNTAEAMAALNRVRERAGMPPKTEITEDILQNERLVELSWENQSYWDLRRWRIAQEVLDGVRMAGVKWWYLYETKKYQVELINAEGVPRLFQDHNYYLPFGTARVAENPNLVENPGY